MTDWIGNLLPPDGWVLLEEETTELGHYIWRHEAVPGRQFYSLRCRIVGPHAPLPINPILR